MTQRIKGERGMEIAAHIVMIILTILAIAPFLLMVSGSLTSDNALIRTGYRFIPPELSTASYQYLFSEASQIGRAYLVTIVVTAHSFLCLFHPWQRIPYRKNRFRV